LSAAASHPAPARSRSVGHKGKFGHEFMEFEFNPSGVLRYANNSNYKNDTMIRKEVTVRYARVGITESRRVRALRCLVCGERCGSVTTSERERVRKYVT
jgi:hypothetical protein